MSPRVTDLLLEKVGFVHEQNLNPKTKKTAVESLNFPTECSLKYTTGTKYTSETTFTTVWIVKSAFQGRVLRRNLDFSFPV